MGKSFVLHTADAAINPHERIAAIRYHNGTNIPVARIDGGENYSAAMLDLLRASNNDDELTTQQIEHQSYGRTFLDYLQRLVFHPFKGWFISQDPEVLTVQGGTVLTMIEALKKEVERYLTVPLKTIALSTPGFLNTSQWRTHFLSAAERAGLDVVTGTLRPEMNAMEAASAAYGIGLCRNYTDLPSCYYELDLADFESVLAIEYTNMSLAGIFTSRYPEMTYMASLDEAHTFSDTDLGANSRQDGSYSSCESAKDYWERVRRRLRQLRIQDPQHPLQLVLLGEDASDPDFLEVVRTAFPNTLPLLHRLPLSLAQSEFHSGEMTIVDPLYAAALGAAELAKRTLEAPGAAPSIGNVLSGGSSWCAD